MMHRLAKQGTRCSVLEFVQAKRTETASIGLLLETNDQQASRVRYLLLRRINMYARTITLVQPTVAQVWLWTLVLLQPRV